MSVKQFYLHKFLNLVQSEKPCFRNLQIVPREWLLYVIRTCTFICVMPGFLVFSYKIPKLKRQFLISKTDRRIQGIQFVHEKDRKNVLNMQQNIVVCVNICDFGSLCDTIRIWKQGSGFRDFLREKIVIPGTFKR